MRFLVVVFLMISAVSFSQTFEMESLIKEVKNGTLNGVVGDNEMGNEPLAFATVKIKETNTSINTELDGSFSFSLKPGVYTLELSFVGYVPIIVKNVSIQSNKITSSNQTLNALNINSLSVISQSEK